MKKFLLVFEPPYFSMAAMEFARQHDEIEPVLLKGLFSSHLSMHNLWAGNDHAVGALFNSTMEDDPVHETSLQIDFFKEFCEKNQIMYSVQNDLFNYSLKELRLDTRNADMLIVVSSKVYERPKNGKVDSVLQGLVSHSECPLMLVPPEAPPSSHTYVQLDGSPESSFALKQFIYLLPEWEKKPSYLIEDNCHHLKNPTKEWHPEYQAARYFNQIYKRQKGLLITGIKQKEEELVTLPEHGLRGWALENRIPMFLCPC
jgi:hypothetical protein